MTGAAPFSPHVVVMAKTGTPGTVKTRLIGGLGAVRAAAVHEAMLRCVLERVECHVPGTRVLALAGTPQTRRGSSAGLAEPVPRGWRVVDQGAGGLGERLDQVWRAVGRGPIIFFGVDSPDVPAEALRAIAPALRDTDAAVGPVSDGGYWTLAARRYVPALLRGIDWGGANVYHQTLTAAARAGVSVTTLPGWHDVDRPEDLAALRRRLESASHPLDPALLRLRSQLRRACEDPS